MLYKKSDINVETAEIKIAQAHTAKKYIKATHPRVKRAYAMMLYILQNCESS
jgi:hypothetical protein